MYVCLPHKLSFQLLLVTSPRHDIRYNKQTFNHFIKANAVASFHELCCGLRKLLTLACTFNQDFILA